MLNLISLILLNQAIQLRLFYSIEIHLDWEESTKEGRTHDVLLMYSILSVLPYVVQSMEREKICYDCDYRVAIAENINKNQLFHIQMHRKNIIQKI
jgi:hypothetical protein